MDNKQIIEELQKHPDEQVFVQISEHEYKPVVSVKNEVIINYPVGEDTIGLVIKFAE